MMNKKVIFSIAISVVLVWFLLSQIEVGAIVKTLKDVPPGLLLFGFAFYILSYLFRALRFQVLLGKDIGILPLFNIVSVHTMWTNILPLRAGELSYLYLLKKQGGTDSLVTGIPSLILSRVFDLAAVLTLFVFSFIGVGTLPGELRRMGYVLIFFVLCLLAITTFLLWKRERFLGRAKYYILRFGLEKIRLVEKMLGKGGEILEGFNKARSWKVIFMTALYSQLTWISIYICNFALIRAVGVNLSLLQIFFISTFFVLFSLLPIQGWAGFGTTEAVWVLTIIWFGVSKETGIITGFQLHILGLAFTMLTGLVGFILSFLERRVSGDLFGKVLSGQKKA